MKKFEKKLRHKIQYSIHNNFGLENFDNHRFAEIPILPKISMLNRFKSFLKKNVKYKTYRIANSCIQKLEYRDELEWLWNHLNHDDKKLLIELITYRILGFRRVKLSRNNYNYRRVINKAKSMADFDDTLDPKFMHFLLYKMDLTSLGKNIKFYFSPNGIAIDFMLEQYAYKKNKKTIVEASNGDVVLDLGGCWADTAIYFADKVGEKGKVFSFEFIPNNISIFQKNVLFNKHLSKVINLISHPVSNVSGELVYFFDEGPGSKIKSEPFENQTGKVETISIDDFVQRNNLETVDFIKMDIEGAELQALNGAIHTINKFKPKLAIAIYHSMSDFVKIPRWIIDLNLGYEIYLDHFTIHSEETVIYAKIKS